MNHVATRDGTESVVREIIDSHEYPDYVRGYDVRLDEFDGMLGFWITFKVLPLTDRSEAAILERGHELVEIQRLLDPEFRDRVDERFPFYRFAEVGPDTPG